MKAIARKSHALSPKDRSPTKNFYWEGWIRKRKGYVWRCGHDHFRRDDGRKCAAKQLRQIQKGRVAIPVHQIDDSIDWMGRRPIRGMTETVWEEMKRAADYRCVYCHRRKPLVKEHVTPLARGGKHDVRNIAPSCRRCNTRKGTMTGPEFRRLIGQ